MSGRFVRASSYRHVFGQPAKPENTFKGAEVNCAGDGEFIASNGKFMAFACRGGGGPVGILRNDQPGRISRPKKIDVHRARVLDFDFNPFDNHLLATCAEDNYVKLSKIPEGGLTEDIKTPLVSMQGHEKKVIGLKFNPVSSNILASVGFDHKLKVWDVESGQAALEYDTQHGDALNHVRWSYDGSQLATTCKDKKVRIFDPRDQKVAGEVAAFAGSKKASVEWVSKLNQIAVTGFTKSSMRQIKLYDTRDLSRAVHTEDIDQSAGVLIPYYDDDTSVLFVGGKGDSTVRILKLTALDFTSCLPFLIPNLTKVSPSSLRLPLIPPNVKLPVCFVSCLMASSLFNSLSLERMLILSRLIFSLKLVLLFLLKLLLNT